MALRALGRSRVITATPLGETLPLTKSSELPAMAEKVRGESGAPRRPKRMELGFRARDWDLEQGIEERGHEGFGRMRSREIRDSMILGRRARVGREYILVYAQILDHLL